MWRFRGFPDSGDALPSALSPVWCTRMQRAGRSSKRATDLCANARNVAAARDYQASVAKDALEAGAHGPGVPLVGAYNGAAQGETPRAESQRPEDTFM